MRFDFLHDPRPILLERALSIRLPHAIYLQTVVAAALSAAIVIAAGVETLRVRAARAEEIRAQRQFEKTRDALSAVRLQWQQVDQLAVRDRRLREIRLSGSQIAVRIARMGNAFPRRAWATSLSATSSGYVLKARAEDLSASSQVLASLLRDGAFTRDAAFRISRDGAGNGAFGFEVRSGQTP